MRRWKGSKSKSDRKKSPVAVAKPRPALMMALEPRMMFDAAAVATAEAAHADHTNAISESPPADVVFVDAKVKDADSLLASVAPGTQVVRLDAGKDGLQQIAGYLSAHPGAASVQIIAEGYEGDLWLGSTYLSADNVAEHATTLAQIGAGMQTGGDILIFGCSTGAGEQGSALVTSLATLTGRDVAASDDRTGARGDWELEIVKGTIESSSALSLSATASYAYDLATITVTNGNDDGPDSLRDALAAASDGDTITFSSSMEVSLTTGALSIDKSLTIDGDLDDNNSADVILSANYESAVLSVTAGTVSLQGLIITEGLVSGNGGGYASLAGGDALGAGISVTGAGTQVTILDSTITSNVAAGGGGGGSGDGYGYGGGGGGGYQSTGGGNGGAYSADYAGGAGGDGFGGIGGYASQPAQAGQGGSTVGGAGGVATGGTVAGGAGATAGTIGGGGGGVGSSGGATGGRGGNAAGGLYVGGGATVYMANTTVSNNNGAGGGGGGGYQSQGGDGGAGTGGIHVVGTLRYQSSTTTFMSNFGSGGEGGDSSASTGALGGSFDHLNGDGATLVDGDWAPVGDATPPTVSSVSVPASATYAIGQNLDFTVNFDEAVTVDTGGGTPYIEITLDTGGTVLAAYVAGSGTSALTFSYTILSGELDTDGISLGSSIVANGGTIRDAATNDATLTLNNVGSTTDVLVDAVAPTVTSIFRSSDETTNATTLQFGVSFSEDVSGLDIADFTLFTTGTVTGTIDSVEMSDGIYAVSVTGVSGDGTLRVDFNSSGTGVTDAAGNAIDGGFTSGEAYIIDQTAPSVTSVSVPADDIYTVEESLEFTVTFDEVVNVNEEEGTPYLEITLDTGGTVQAAYVSGTETNTLTFRYTVANGDVDSDGISVGSLVTNNGTIRDVAGNDAVLTLNGVGSTTAVLVDAVAPYVTSITRVSAETTNATSVDYMVTFSEDVTGVDIADFSLTSTGDTTGTIASISGSGTTYTVTVTDISGDGTLRLELNGEVDITDAAGNLADGGFNDGHSYTFDYYPPSVSSVSVPSDGTYAVGQDLDFIVNFDEDVNIYSGTDGHPYLTLTLETGGSVQANYFSGDGTSALTFRYTVASGDLDSDGISVGSIVANSGAAIRDLAGNDADLTLNELGSTAAVLVDGVVPSVTSITRAGSATTSATSVDYTVTFSESVNGVDAAAFTLTTTGDTTGTITSVVGGGTTYTVTVASITGDGTLRLDLNGSGTEITDAAANGIAAGFTTGEVYTFDYTAPSVTSVSVPADGSYGVGQDLDFTVTFDEVVIAVTGDGTPSIDLTLDTGGTVQAVYVAGSGTTALTFRYTVVSGDLDSTGISLGASIVGNGGAIIDGANNPASLTLNNIDSTVDVLVETIAPSVASIDRVTGATTNATSLQYTVTFSESVSGVDTADFTLTSTGTATGTIASVSGSGTTYTVTVNSVSGDGTLRLDLNASGTGITDVAGNAIDSGFISGQLYTVDQTAPSVTSVTVVNSSASYGVDSTLEYRVNFDENVTVDTAGGTPRIAITLDTGGTGYASYAGGSGTAALTFLYTIVAGDEDLTGVTLAGSLDANGGTLRDSAGNDVNATLNNVGDTTAVLVDGVAPTLTSITRVGAATTNASSLDFTVTFSEVVRFVDANSFTLTLTGTASGTIASVTSSDNITYTVTIASVSGEGTLRLDVKSTTGIVDGPDNPLVGGFTGGEVYTLDHTAPNVTSVTVPANRAYGVGQNLDFTVNFTEAVTAVTGDGTPYIDLTLDTGGLVRAVYVSGSGTTALTFRYTVASGNVDGTGISLGSSIVGNGGAIIDAANNLADLTLNSVGNTTAVLVDGIAPATTTSSVPANGEYHVGQHLDFTVSFDETLIVNLSNGTPSIQLTIGGSPVDASYLTGSGSNVLTFRYTGQANDLDGDGIAVASSITLNGSKLQDAAGNDAALTFTAASTAGVLVNGVNPNVTSVTVPTSRTYGAGENLDFILSFDEAVIVDATGGTPYVDLTLDTGGTVRAAYLSGSGTSALTFRYVVASGDMDADGVALGSNLVFNGGTVRDGDGNDTNTALSGATSGVLVEAVAPTVSSITLGSSSPTNATSVIFRVNFSESVSGLTADDFTLFTTGSATGTVASIAPLSAAAYDVTVTGVSGVGTLRLDVGPSTDVTDLFGNALGAFSSGEEYTIDSAGPTVAAVSVPTDDTYVVGETLDFTVELDEAVTVDSRNGTPALELIVGTTTRQASYVSGSGTTGLLFRYTVQAGDLDSDGIAVGNLVTNGGALQDALGNAADLTVSNVASTAGVLVDAVAPSVTAVAPPADGTYSQNEGLDFVVSFDESVTVDTSGGSPSIDLTLDVGGTYQATYVSGSGTGALTFRFTSMTGVLDSDGVTLGSSITANGSTIKDSAGNDAVLTLNNVGSTTAVLVDAVPPNVASVTVPSAGTYTAGDTLSFTVNFDSAVLVDSSVGTPRIELTVGGSPVHADYVSGSGTSALVFNYTVVSGQVDSDGVAVGSNLDLRGGTIRDAAGNDAESALNLVGDTSVVLVDAQAPEISGSSAPSDGTYGSGQDLDFTINFDESVVVDTTNGTPRLALNFASGTAYADYVSGSGTSALVFRHTVVTDDLAASGFTSASSIDVNGGTIEDAAGNDAAVSFAGFSLSGVHVDGVVPVITSVTAPSSATYVAGETLSFTMKLSEAVTVDTSGGTPRIELIVGGSSVYAGYTSGNGTSALVFSYTVVSGQVDTDGVVLGSNLDLQGGTVRDAAGNDAETALNAVDDLSGVLVDAQGPQPGTSSAPSAGTYGVGQDLDFTIVYSENVVVATTGGTPRLALNFSSGTVYADYLSGSGTNALVFRHTVQAGELALNGFTSASSLDLNGGTLEDAAGNDAAVTFGGFNLGGVQVDGVAPLVTSVAVPSATTYVAGETLAFTVKFDEAVTVDTSGGTPRIALTVGSNTVYADYASGSGTSGLVFSYTLTSGELDIDGVVLGSSLELNGGALTDAAGNDAALTLNAVDDTSAVRVDAVVPSVTSITRVGAATTNATSAQYTVTFSESVTGVGTDDFTLATMGTAAGTIASISGSGTTYTVTVSDITGAGTLRLDLNNNGTGISDAAGNAIGAGFSGGETYTVDRIAPSVTSVAVPSNGAYGVGRDLDFTVNFDDNVTVDTSGGTPRLALTVGGNSVFASYVAGDGTSALTFRYTVASGDVDADGIAVAASIDANGGTLRDAVGNDATLTLNAVASTTQVLVETTAPTITTYANTSGPIVNGTDGTYLIEFSEAVTGLDLSDFIVTSTGDAVAVLNPATPGAPGQYLIGFRNSGGEGTISVSLRPSNHGITDLAGNRLVGGFTGTPFVFDYTAPSVVSVDVPTAGTYAAGAALDFTVHFNETVRVEGAPRLALTLATGGTVYADYVSGDNSSAVTFRYNVVSGVLDSDGISLASSIDLNGGGVVKDVANTNALLTLNNVGDASGVLVDAVAPSVASIVRVGAATTSASSVAYTVTFSEDVSGVDAADFALTMTGATTGTIAAVTQVDASTYTVTVSGITGDGTLRLDASGTGITDVAGNGLDGGFTTGEVYTFDHSIPDTTGPAVVSVGVPSADTYAAGDTLDFTVNFDEVVTVDTTGGTPRLALTLDTGGTVYASYVSGSGTPALVFSYTVLSGELDGSGISVGSLDASGGTLRDIAGNDAALTLNSIGSTSGVLVDAVAPTVTSIVRVGAATTNATSVQYTVTFSESVTGVDVTDFAMTATGTVAGTIAAISGSGTTYTVTVSSITGDGTLRLDLKGSGTAISDAAGNAIGNGFTGGAAYTFDRTAPRVSSVSVPANGIYAAGQNLDFIVHFDESVTVDATDHTPRLALTLDTGGTVYANYLSGSGNTATFRYTVSSGQIDSDGITVGSLDTNGGSIYDTAGNDADLTLNNVGSTSAVLVDAEAPTVASIVRVGAATTSASSVAYTVTFSEAVSGVDTSDFALTATGATTGTIASVTQVNASTYTVTVSGITGDGTLRLDASGGGITDVAGNMLAGSFSTGEVYILDHTIVDATGPAVVSVGVPNADTYVAGESLAFIVNFNEVVIVDTTSGTPRIALALGSDTVYASYVSGSGTTALTFSYTVMSGELDSDGVVMGSSIDANGGTLRDSVGNDATTTFRNVDDTSVVLVDAVAPGVMSITSGGSAPTNSSTALYNVTFSESVSGVDVADFTLTATGTASGTIASILEVSRNTYAVVINGIAGSGTLRLDLNASGTGIADTAGNRIGNGFDAGAIQSRDLVTPSVLAVAVPLPAVYGSGDTLDFTVNFDEAVTVDATGGTPRLVLTVGTSTVYADYIAGSGTAALTFTYTVASGELDSDGIVVGSSIDANGGTLRDSVGNDAATMLSGIGSTTAVRVDAVAPSVASIVRVGAATTSASSVAYTVTFSEGVSGVDAADFALTATGATTGTIASVTQVDASTYTVIVSGITGDGTLRLDASGTGVTDLAGNLLAGSFTTGESFAFDHSVADTTGPAVVSVGVPSGDTYGAGETLQLTVHFDEIVTVDTTGGTPRLALAVGSNIVYADYVAGSGSPALTFSYTVMSGELDSDGIVVGSSIDANGGTLRDDASNDATLTLNGVGSTTGVLVDAVAPSVVSIVRVDGAITNASSVQYTVTFDEPVSGIDVADFSLHTTGNVAGTIASIVGSGTTYVVTVGGVTGDGTLRLDLNSSGTGITDAAGTGISGGFTGADLYTFDHTPASVVSVAVPTSGIYVAGDPLVFTVLFDEVVIVDPSNGVPRLAITLDTGGTVYATYVSGTATNALTFSYTVTSGELDSNGISVGGSIDANGSQVLDIVGNDAILTLNQVGDTSVVCVDGIVPGVVAITAGNASPSSVTSAVYTVVFSEDVSGVDSDDFTLSTTGSAAGTIGSITRVNGSTYTVSIANITGDGTLRLDLNASGTGIADVGGNSIAGGFSGDAVSFDHSPPAVVMVGVPAPRVYGAGATLGFSVQFDEAVTLDTSGGTPRLAILLTNGATVYADYVSGSGTAMLTFDYVVAENLTSVGINVVGIDANGGVLRNAVGSDAVLAMHGAGDTSGVTVDSVAPSVMPIDPPATAASNASSVTYTVTFSEDVLGVPDLRLTSTGTITLGVASVIRTSGHTFRVTITGIAGDGTVRLQVLGSGVTDLAGAPVTQAFAVEYLFDHTAPGVVGVDRPTSGNYLPGQSLEFTVHFDENVTVDTTSGTPRMAIQLGSGTVYANYVAGSGSDALTFRYLVGSLDVGPNGVSVASNLELNGGTMMDAAGNHATLALTGLAIVPEVTVGRVNPIVVVTPPSSVPSSTPLLIPQLPLSSALPPILNAFNNDGGTLIASTAADSGGAPNSMVRLAGLTPNRENGPVGNGNNNGFGNSASPGAPASGSLPGRTELHANRGVLPITVAVNKPVSFTLPADTFLGNAAGRLAFDARLADGQPLPGWLKFDARSGTFSGEPPPGVSTTISIQVTARDSNGQAAVVVVEVQVGGSGQPARSEPEEGASEPATEPVSSTAAPPALDQVAAAPGKASLSSQFRAHGFHARQREVDTLVQHVREPVSASSQSVAIAKVKKA